MHKRSHALDAPGKNQLHSSFYFLCVQAWSLSTAHMSLCCSYCRPADTVTSSIWKLTADETSFHELSQCNRRETTYSTLEYLFTAIVKKIIQKHIMSVISQHNHLNNCWQYTLETYRSQLFMLHFHISFFQFSILSCYNAVVMVWLGLDTKKTLGEGERHVLT